MASLQKILIGGILFIAMFAGLISMYGMIHQQYEGETYYNEMARDANYWNTTGINESNETYDVARKITSKLNETASDTSNLDVNVVGAITAGKLIFSMFDLVKEVINFVAITLQIPTWITAAVLAVFLIIATLAVIEIITGRNTR